MTISPELGQEHSVALPQGEVRYFERGSGRPVVFVHGVLTNADLCRKVVPGIADAGFRCLAPDWPLGAHEVPMASDADLGPPAVADMIASFLEMLDLHNVILVANDTGGALAQIMLARRPERVDQVVLLPCDCFKYFFPPIFKPLSLLAHVPGALRPLAALASIRALHRLPFTFGWVTKRPIPDNIVQSYLKPVRSPAIRRDLRKFLRAVDSRHTLAAAEQLRQFFRPVLLLWGSEEKLFPPRLARRLVETLPAARLVEVADTYTFVSEDQPEAVVRQVVEFARAPAGTFDP